MYSVHELNEDSSQIHRARLPADKFGVCINRTCLMYVTMRTATMDSYVGRPPTDYRARLLSLLIAPIKTT